MTQRRVPHDYNGYAIELFFDQESERRILEFREKLYQAGIKPVLGGTNDRPHISLAVYTHADEELLQKTNNKIAKQFSTIPFQLSALGVFPRKKNILFLFPVPSHALLDIHARLHEMMKGKDFLSLEYYHPNQWIPHCTLETGISDPQLRKAVALGKTLFTPITGRLVEIGTVKFQPVDYLSAYALTRKEP